jgi:hypothetical protein
MRSRAGRPGRWLQRCAWSPGQAWIDNIRFVAE